MGVEIVFQLETSALLRGSIDERFFSIWEFAGDGAFSGHREEKDELECLVEQVLTTTSDAELRNLARVDTRLMSGLSSGTVGGFDPDTGDLRTIAVRQVERAMYGAYYTLLDSAYQPASAKDRVCQTVRGFFERLRTADLLLPLSAEMVKSRAGFDDRAFCVDGFAVYPHPALRPARELVKLLCGLVEGGYNVKVAVDPHAVVPIAKVQSAALFDYWRGVKLGLQTIDDPNAIGTTVHARRSDQQDRHMFSLLRTEFRWSLYEAGQKSFEVQETVPRSAVRSDHGRAWVGSRYVQNRYLHSIRDTAAHTFIHLDGAAKAFPRDKYGPTTTDPTASQGTPRYRKLFRVDGEIPDQRWADLVTYFFRDNELVIEYLGAIRDELGNSSHGE
jgi:hypothetical protein